MNTSSPFLNKGLEVRPNREWLLVSTKLQETTNALKLTAETIVQLRDEFNHLKRTVALVAIFSALGIAACLTILLT